MDNAKNRIADGANSNYIGVPKSYVFTVHESKVLRGAPIADSVYFSITCPKNHYNNVTVSSNYFGYLLATSATESVLCGKCDIGFNVEAVP